VSEELEDFTVCQKKKRKKVALKCLPKYTASQLIKEVIKNYNALTFD
jgi:hypothetical protein